MKRIAIFMLHMLLVMVLVGCSNGDTDEKATVGEPDIYVIKAGHAAKEDHFGHKTFEKFKELVETNSNGRIKVEIYPNGELGGERVMLENLLLGELTMMAPSHAPLDAVSKTMAVWDLPYLFKDAETAHEVLDGEVGQAVLNSMSDKGIQGLVYWENGFRHLTNNVRPITNVADLNGLNMRTLESPMQIKMWSLTGANATPIAFTELYDALKQQKVDAQETPLSLMHAQKFYEVQKYLTLTSHLYGPWPVIINKEFYDNLPDELQKVVLDAAVETSDYNRQLSKEDEIVALKLLKEQGMQVTELTEEQKEQFKAAMSDVYSEIRKEVGEEFFDQLMKKVSM